MNTIIKNSQFAPIRRKFPCCYVAAIEAVSKSQFYDITDFNKVYGYQTFLYEKESNHIEYDESSSTLNIHFSRDESVMNSVYNSITDLYGVSVEPRSHETLEEYLSFLNHSLDDGVPVMSDFSMGYIKQKRQYLKVFGNHLIIFLSYDAEKKQYLAAEQDDGFVEIDLEDLENCFYSNLKSRGEFLTHDVVYDEFLKKK